MSKNKNRTLAGYIYPICVECLTPEFDRGIADLGISNETREEVPMVEYASLLSAQADGGLSCSVCSREMFSTTFRIPTFIEEWERAPR